MNGRELSIRRLLFAIPLAFLALFYLYPLTRIALQSLFPAGSWNPGQLSALTDSPVYLRILWFTIWQAALSTLLTLLFALPGALVFARYRFAGKGLFLALMTVPFVLPTVVTATAFRALLGPSGILNEGLMALFSLEQPPIRIEQSLIFFLLAHIFYNYSLVLRLVSSYWAGLNPSLTAAAQLLGASPWQTFRRVTLPLLLPAITAAALLVFIFCFTSFGIILILGGPGYATIEVEIYRQAVQLYNLPMAAALSLVQIGVNFFLMWLHARLGKNNRLGFFSDSRHDVTKEPHGVAARLLVAGNLLFLSLLLLSPLLALVLRSLRGDTGLTLAYYRALGHFDQESIFFVAPLTAVWNSLGFAMVAMVLAVLLGLAAATALAGERGRATSFWDALLMLPLATSAVTLGFGYIISLNRPPVDLRDSLALVPIAHTLVAFPFVLRCILPSLRQIPATLREAATLLGASPFMVWRRVDFPMSRRAILVGAVFAFSISMGEFGASAFVTRPHTATMPVAIFRFLSQPGEMNYGQAMAMSTILMLVTCAAFWLLGRFSTTPTPPNHPPT